jgi:hypothetical protein
MVDLQRGPADAVAQEHTVKNVKLNFDVLYEMTLRNQYFVPSKKSPFVTVDYLIKVKNKEVFCPLYDQIRLKACPTPPTKAQLLLACCSVQDDNNIDLGLKVNGSLPNTQWMLAILSTYEQDNHYFSKGFRPVKVKPDRKLINNDGFFDDLPPSLTQSKGIKRSAVIKRLLEPKPIAVKR